MAKPCYVLGKALAEALGMREPSKPRKPRKPLKYKGYELRPERSREWTVWKDGVQLFRANRKGHGIFGVFQTQREAKKWVDCECPCREL